MAGVGAVALAQALPPRIELVRLRVRVLEGVADEHDPQRPRLPVLVALSLSELALFSQILHNEQPVYFDAETSVLSAGEETGRK